MPRKTGIGNHERPVGGQETRRPVGGRRLDDRTLVPADHAGDTLVEAERLRHRDPDGGAVDHDVRILGGGSVGAIEGDGAHVRGRGRKLDARGDRLDRHVPFVAGEVPVELVVILEDSAGR